MNIFVPSCSPVRAIMPPPIVAGAVGLQELPALLPADDLLGRSENDRLLVVIVGGIREHGLADPPVRSRGPKAALRWKSRLHRILTGAVGSREKRRLAPPVPDEVLKGRAMRQCIGRRNLEPIRELMSSREGAERRHHVSGETVPVNSIAGRVRILGLRP